MTRRLEQGWRLPEAVPPLNGLAWPVFLAVWIAAAALAVVGCGFYLRDDVNLSPRADYRFGLVMKNPFNTGVETDGTLIGLVLSDEAKRSGLRANDRVLAIDGRAPSGGQRPIPALWHALGEPSSVTLSTISPDGRRTVHRLTSRPGHADEGIVDSGISYRTWRVTRTMMLLVNDSLIPLLLGVLLIIRRSRDPLAPWVSLAFVLSSATTGMASRSTALLDALPSIVWLITSFASSWLSFATLTVFPDGRFRPKWCWAILLVELAFSIVLTFASLSLPQENLLLAVSFIPPIAVVWAKYRAMPAGPTRQQIRWVLFGLALSVLAFFVGVGLQSVEETTLSPAVFIRNDLAANTAFDLYNALLLVAMTVGLMRYRLYDADATISRSVAYGTMTLSLVAIFAGTEKAIEVLGEEYFGGSLGAFANALGAAVAAAMIGPVHGRATKWAERRFRSGLAHLRHGLPLLVGDMRETATPTALADTMLARVEKGVRARHGAVVIGDGVLDARDISSTDVAGWLAQSAIATGPGSKMSCDRNDAQFPLRIPLHADGVGLVGWLLLGPRPDGSFYGREEREALRDIADPVARALAVSLERQRRLDEWQAREESLHQKVGALQRIVRGLQERLGFESPAGDALSRD